MIALGEVLDTANELRKTAAAQGKQFAVSEAVYAAAGLDLPPQDRITLSVPGLATPVTASLSASGPVLPASWKPIGAPSRVKALQRLWSGG